MRPRAQASIRGIPEQTSFLPAFALSLPHEASAVLTLGCSLPPRSVPVRSASTALCTVLAGGSLGAQTHILVRPGGVYSRMQAEMRL